MVNTTSSTTRLVLIGGGISHIYMLSKLIKRLSVTGRLSPKLETVLITPTRRYFCPIMVGSFLEGKSKAEELLFDLEKLCHNLNTRFIHSEINQIVMKERLIYLSDGNSVPYDILSVDLSHHLEGEEIEGVKKFAFLMNSFENLEKLQKHLRKRLIDCNITIVGSSARAVELVFAIWELTRELGLKARITMIDAAHSILPGYDYQLKNMIGAELKKRQVELILGRRITLVTEDFLVFDDRTILKHDDLIWITDPVADSFIKQSGLTVDDKGFMVVNHHLRSVDASNIFGVGGSLRVLDGNYFKMRDCATIEAILLANIKNRINRVPAKRVFDPARKHLQLLSLGAGVGIIYNGYFWFKGKPAWYVKHYLHKRFVKQIATY